MRICHLAVVLGGLAVAPVALGQLTFTANSSSYLGGSSWEQARDIYHDAAGFTYIVGRTDSRNFPGALNAYAGGSSVPSDAASSFGGSDAYVTKIDPSGQVMWTRLLGGPNYDRAYAVEVDGAGN